MNDKDLLDLVEHAITARQNGNGHHFHVQRNSVRHEGNWTYIIVLPEPEDMRASRYADFLGDVEDAIYKQTNQKLLLVPAMPD